MEIDVQEDPLKEVDQDDNLPEDLMPTFQSLDVAEGHQEQQAPKEQWI